jgi:GH3 auxin-responsive promoter
MTLAAWLNTAWMLKCAGEARAFRQATRRVAESQSQVLAAILHRNRDTEFGRAQRFRYLKDARDYQKCVPLSRYDDYAEPIQRIAAGQANVLTRDRVELLEPTSGTTAGEKLIPYTAGLRRQFQRAVAAWIYDLFRRRPAVRRGRAYWSISPVVCGARRTSAGIPIGFDDDAAYLGTLERRALERLLVVPSAVARLRDMETFRYQTLLHLLSAEDLTLISIWNPSFLTALVAPLSERQDRLRFDLRRQNRSSGRASTLERIFRSNLSLPEKLRLVWPRLALISCWTDAAAAHYLRELREYFPAVEIQPKGLLATEAFVSFPLVGRAASVLALRSHFFEFQQADGEPCLGAHELELGRRYAVVITTGGGLYRYQLDDQVEVAGFENACPLVRFLGKSNCTSDLVGEKLAEPHVRAVLERLFVAHGLSPRFALLAPVVGRPAHYRLFLQGVGLGECGALQGGLEAGLEENPHYRYAVQLKQLAPVEIEVLDPRGEAGWRIYERRCLARGRRAGNVKPMALDNWTGWSAEFRTTLQNSALTPRS